MNKETNYGLEMAKLMKPELFDSERQKHGQLLAEHLQHSADEFFDEAYKIHTTRESKQQKATVKTPVPSSGGSQLEQLFHALTH
jgi:hypothetical protein